MKIQLKRKLGAGKLKVICRQYASMIRAGCDFIFITESIGNLYSGFTADVMHICRRNLEVGKSISQSFALTNQFSKLFIGMLYAGESSGKLDLIFEKLANYYEREEKLKKNLLNASIYPLVLILASIISGIFLLVFVVPNFQLAFSTSGVSSSENIVFRISSYLRLHYIDIILKLVLIISMLVYEIKTNERILYMIKMLKYKLPKIKSINMLLITDNFSRTLSILLSSGVNIEEALDIICSMSKDQFIYGKLKLVKIGLLKGKSLSQSISMTGIFPKLFISMLTVGENTGMLDEKLNEISKAYEEELDMVLNNFTKLIEPVMIIVIGLFIGFVMISLLSPMFSLISNIK